MNQIIIQAKNDIIQPQSENQFKRSKSNSEDNDLEPTLQKKLKLSQPLDLSKSQDKQPTNVKVDVDEYVLNREKYHVLSEFDKLYDCTMTLTDIIDFRNNNKFFVVQVLETDAEPREYYAFNRWARGGAAGSFDLMGPWSKDACIQDYQGKVHEKIITGNFRILDRDQIPSQDPEISRKQQDEAFDKNQLHIKVKELIKQVFDLKMVNKQMMEIGCDLLRKMPLSPLAKITVDKGFGLLEQISQTMKRKSSQAELEKLTSEFFRQIPQEFNAPAIKRHAEYKTKLEVRQKLLLIVDEIHEKILAINEYL